MATRGIIALGIGQCVNWGVLYYAFPVLLLPVEAALGAERWVVGAFGVVTLVGGLASTVFLPLTDALVRVAGWRAAVVALAVLIALSTWMIHRIAFAGSREGRRRAAILEAQPAPTTTNVTRGPKLWFLMLGFGTASLSSAALIANLVPALAERAVTPAAAAAFGAMFGLMQLPGRALMMHGRFSISPPLLLTGSLALQALGLLTWAMLPSVLSAFVGIGVFAMGSGLMTLARPYLVHAVVERHETGYMNGRIAQAQQLARAAGPVLAAWAVTVVSYSAVLAVLGVVFAGLAVSSLLQAGLRESIVNACIHTGGPSST